MKMNVIFEEKDFEGSGQYLVRSNDVEIKDTGDLLCELYKVGWYRSYNSTREDKATLISMSDGMCFSFKDKNTLIEYLNICRDYRLATKSEVIRVIEYQFRNK